MAAASRTGHLVALGITVLLLGSASPLRGSEPAVTLTLGDAIRRALDSSPGAQLAQAQEDGARAALRQSRSAWLPHVSVSQSYNRGDHPVYVFGALLEQGIVAARHFDPNFLNDPPSIANYRAGVTLQYPLFDQLRRVTSTGQARLGSERAAHEHEAARQALRLEAIRLYANAVLAREAVSVARLSVSSAAADVEAIRARVEAGLLVESDLLAASVQLAELRQQELRAAGDQAIADAALRALVGMEPGEPIALSSDLRLPLDRAPLEDLLARAESSRPELRASRLAAEASRLEVRKARGAYLPRVDGFAAAGGSGGSLGDYHGDRLYGLTLSLDLLRPGRDGSVAAALAQQRAAEAMERRRRDESRVEIISAWEDLRVARQRREVAREAVLQARETMRIVRDRYDAGLITVTEHLRAQSALSRAELAVHAAENETITAHARLLRAAGTLQNAEDFTHE